MGTPLELLIYICLFSLGLGALVLFLGESSDDKRKLRAAHERGRHNRDPWSVHPSDGRGPR